ncbi:MAG: hypothetical protein AAF519_16795 [Bacteroidota bacterium]
MEKIAFGLVMLTSTAFGQLPDNPEEYFDFWLGEWQATWEEGDGKVGKGINRIKKILDDKVILENFEITAGQSKGFKGTSISVYQTQLKTWKQSWADNQSTFYYFKGKVDGSNRIFQTETFETNAGRKITQRMVFKEIKAKSMVWDWESSVDGGETWTLNWRINYTKE